MPKFKKNPNPAMKKQAYGEARAPFKLKSSPAKGKLQDFFNTIGSQLKANKRDIGADLKSKYSSKAQRADEVPRSGESKYQFDVRTRKPKSETSKAKRNMIDKNKDNISDLIQPHSITDPTPKHMTSTVSSKALPKPHTFTIGNRTYRKTQSEITRDFEPDALFEYSYGPNDPRFSWRTHNPKDPKYQEIVEAHEKSLSPVEKKSPYKKGLGSYAKQAKGSRGYKMKRK